MVFHFAARGLANSVVLALLLTLLFCGADSMADGAQTGVPEIPRVRSTDPNIRGLIDKAFKLSSTFCQAIDPHVRTSDSQLQVLIANATERSATFRSLIAKLNESDVIVYVEARVTRADLGGSLLHRIVVRETRRYLRLIVKPHGRDERLMAVLAHELQHALEIAQTPEVGRSETVQELFARIGFLFGCSGCYETFDAIDLERTVREELNASTRAKTDKD